METIKVVVDPNDHFIPKGATHQRLVEATGILLPWALQAIIKDCTMEESCEESYSFGWFEIKGGAVDDDGVRSYPEDPDSYPIVKVELGKETMYIYEHSIVAFVNGDHTFVTRMD